ncbi:unnamed protein product [Schistosoma turkestanicum]|nr:unnamed protein product [Schistosoma turkestanicum]
MDKQNCRQFLQNQIDSIDDVEQRYLNPFSCNTDSPLFSKPSPLECLQRSCNNILQNINPLPYHEIINQVSDDICSDFNYFSNYSSNYSWLKQRRNTKLRQYSFPGSYLFPFSFACNSSFSSVKRNLVRSRRKYKKVLHSNKLLATLNNRKQRSIQLKNKTLINDDSKEKDKSRIQLTSESPQINDAPTQKVCSTQSVPLSSANGSSNNLNRNCTCTICSKIQMFNILLTSWSTLINFVHNLQSNMTLHSNDLHTNTHDNMVCNLDNALKQHDPIITGLEIINDSSILTVNNQNDSQDSDLENDDSSLHTSQKLSSPNH